MSQSASPPQRQRHRRADAERSVAAILDAAVRALRTRPDASVEDIARIAGLSRQTVYAHFASREALIGAVVDRVTAEVIAAMDAAGLDEGPATAALIRLLDAAWQPFERHPFLLHVAVPTGTEQDRQRHEPIVDRLERLIRRGQASGEFDSTLAPAWLITAIIALGHAAGEEVAAGRITVDTATRALRCSALRLVGASVATLR